MCQFELEAVRILVLNETVRVFVADKNMFKYVIPLLPIIHLLRSIYRFI
jgi:hypothetical protein